MSHRQVLALIFATSLFGVQPAAAAMASRTCPGGAPIATFRLAARPSAGGATLPLSTVNVVKPQEVLVYEPSGATSKADKHAAIAVILISEDAAVAPAVLRARPARRHAEWPVPLRAAAVGLVYGPQGVDEKKLNALLRSDPTAIDRLADYADQTSKVEALVQALAKYEQSAPDTGSFQSVLSGFSSQYGVSLPALDRTKPLDQQAAALLRAVTPALAPTASRPTLVQQSGSLAASVASLFFGPPAGLAIGGAALVGNLHTSLFPPADFQSAFTQPLDGGVALCTGASARGAPARLQYVWMLRLLDSDPPAGCRADTAHLPAGWTGAVTIRCPSVAQLKALPHARDWRLVAGQTAAAVPVTIKSGDADAIVTLDLKQARLSPGAYQVAAMWDWTPLPIGGKLAVRPVPDLATASATPESQDRLIAGSGPIDVELRGGDFEFLERAAIAPAARPDQTVPVTFTLPSGKAAGEQRTVIASLDARSLAPGPYVLTLMQVNGSRRDIPLTVHPANPTLASLPLRVNLGESHQHVVLRGTSLERIERLASRSATWTLEPVDPRARNVTERDADVLLDATAHLGERLPIDLFVADLHTSLEVGGAVEVVGPRPAIAHATASITSGLGVELRSDELPADAPVSFALQTRGAGSHPTIRLACTEDSGPALTVRAGEKTDSTTLAFIGSDTLFLSVGAGALSSPGCALGATLTNDATGTSDVYPLGRIVGLPRIETFSIDTTKIADALYAGTLVGEGLERIEKTGWTASTGFPVQGIATPAPGYFEKQTLQIAVPWPPPAPHAPLYVWLRGEREGRLTSAKY